MLGYESACVLILRLKIILTVLQILLINAYTIARLMCGPVLDDEIHDNTTIDAE